jgi:hypothetical protein
LRCTVRLVILGALVLTLADGSAANAQASQEDGRKQAHAMRVSDGSIRVDGRLDDDAWREVPMMTDFVQKEPVEGVEPTDRMEVRIAYDDSALYVGARLFSSAPIQAPMSRRDPGDQAEFVLVSLDTYLDRRTASSFGVTASGVRIDRYHATDDTRADSGFDPVWEAQTSMDDEGWSAELWIPFSQLRFNERDPQVWGLNVQRWIPSLNESVYWEMVPRTEQGWASRFGDLRGLDGIRPRQRIELVPYVTSASQLIGDRDLADPFLGAANLSAGAGLDAKIGIGSSLTLDATVNPDFGQVEADPAEVNLSAFESFFQERRPFFSEGSSLLTGGGGGNFNGQANTFFYSRRIGAAPPGDADGEFVDEPAATTILGAAKLTGRLPSGLSVGALAAVTSEETARTFDSPSAFGSVRVAPQVTYALTRLQQEFGEPGSSAGLLATVVHRGLDNSDPLTRELTRNAFGLNGDTTIRFKDGEYQLSADAGMSYVGGTADAIAEVQRSSARYFNRPDADYVTYDPLRTSLLGARANIDVQRRQGRHWLWDAGAGMVSPGFETNDMGRLNQADQVSLNGRLRYRETVPGRFWRNYQIGLNTNHNLNYAFDRQGGGVGFNGNIEWSNFWSSSANVSLFVRKQNMRLTRGGPTMQQTRAWQTRANIQSPDSGRTRVRLQIEHRDDEDGGFQLGLKPQFTMQPGSQWQLSIEPNYARNIDTQQYFDTVEGNGPAATFGNRYVFGRLDQSTYSTAIRLDYTFKPDLTLQLYAEPFSSSGSYTDIGELAAPRTRQRRSYGTDGTTLTRLADGSYEVTDGDSIFQLDNKNFNVQSFRSNLVLRWEWRPGSTLFVVWAQDRSAETDSGTPTTPGQMFRSLGVTGDNFFAIKTSFWFSP